MAYLTMDITSQTPIVAPPAQRNAALRKAFSWIGEQWHKRFKMLKFTNAATRRYGLKPRSGETGRGHKFRGSYTYRKLHKGVNGQGVRAIGETKPFVWGGGSRANAKASTKVEVTAKRGFGQADCIVNAPTLNLKPKGGTIDLREEFERVAEVERRELENGGILIYENELTRGAGTRFRISA